jgi:hypothetical protein
MNASRFQDAALGTLRRLGLRPPPRTSEDDWSWFARAYERKLGRRYDTAYAALRLLIERSGDTRTIVETGCVRERGDYSAGYSTFVFASVLERYGGHLHTVDVSETNIATCRRITRKHASRIDYYVSDSVAFLRAFPTSHPNTPIDLLYLDSWDYPVSPDDGPREPSQEHCLAELTVASPALHDRSIVLIDDNDLPGGGKPLLAKRLLAERGWTCLLDEQQTLWTRP